MAQSHTDIQSRHLNNKASSLSRTIPCHQVSTWAAFRWLGLALQDFRKAPIIATVYGVLFSILPVVIASLVLNTGNHLIILPASIAFALLGPAFATGLYDVSWELEKGHKPSFKHSVRAMARNPAGEWAFAFILVFFMMVWTRIAALIHALYPTSASPSAEELLSFLTLGSLAGAALVAVAFMLTAFTPQIMVERRVDVMTALLSSINAVRANVKAMLVWCGLICTLVALSIASMGYGFIITLPILAFASWHAYIEVIKTKRPRTYV